MTPIDIPDLQAALEAARLAGDYIRREYEQFIPIPDAPANISTDIDRGSQELILQFLHKRFPDDGLCAEENTADDFECAARPAASGSSIRSTAPAASPARTANSPS